MALGKQNRTDGKAISLKLQLKDGARFLDSARFAIQEKQSDGSYKDVSYETDVAGDLFKIEPRQWQHEGKDNYSFKLALRDPEVNEAYFTEIGLGSALGRGLANSILNLGQYDESGQLIGAKDLTNVQIGLYPQENKQTKKVYPAVALRQGEATETVKWKYDPKAKDSVVPPPRVYEGPDGPANDFKKQQIFFFDKLTEFAKVVEEAAKKAPRAAPKAAAQTQAPANEAAANEPTEGGQDEDQSVPF